MHEVNASNHEALLRCSALFGTAAAETPAGSPVWTGVPKLHRDPELNLSRFLENNFTSAACSSEIRICSSAVLVILNYRTPILCHTNKNNTTNKTFLNF